MFWVNLAKNSMKGVSEEIKVKSNSAELICYHTTCAGCMALAFLCLVHHNSHIKVYSRDTIINLAMQLQEHIA